MVLRRARSAGLKDLITSSGGSGVVKDEPCSDAFCLLMAWGVVAGEESKGFVETPEACRDIRDRPYGVGDRWSRIILDCRRNVSP